MRISDWSSYVCSSDLLPFFLPACHRRNGLLPGLRAAILESGGDGRRLPALHGKAARWFVHRNEPAKAIDHAIAARDLRSEEHTSELQSLMRISYAVFCLKKKTTQQQVNIQLINQ